MSDCNSTPHVHVDEQGFIVKCYHKCKNILTEPAFWLGVTLTFPIEHFLWTKVPGVQSHFRVVGSFHTLNESANDHQDSATDARDEQGSH